MTRQRKWQLRQKAAGRCVKCGGKPLATAEHCETHRRAYNAAQNTRNAARRWEKT